jgi:predicted GH43/DUF377 family glycosyl hydrolase
MKTTKKILAILFYSALAGCQTEKDEDYSLWEEYVDNPVIKTGEEGSWDAGALGSMTVVKANNNYHMYYEAWSVRTDAEWDREEYNTLQIGHATSRDGIHWGKDSSHNPVLPRGHNGEWDDKGTWDPFVIYEDGIFKMWYGGNTRDGGTCEWGYAESVDGSNFVKKGTISNLGEVEDIHVVYNAEDSTYYMYYWDRYYEPLGLFCARSLNETDFDFDNAINIIIENDYEEEMYKFTHVVKKGKLWYMFYADFVRPHCKTSRTRIALSTDGLHWRSYKRNLFGGHDAEIIEINDTLTFAYYGPNNYFDRKDCDIRLMIFPGEFDDIIRE